MPNFFQDESAVDAQAAELQSEADSAYRSLGVRAPARVHAETGADYARRLLKPLQSCSPDWAKADLSRASPQVLGIAAVQIFADAEKHGRRTGVGTGPLRQVIDHDQAGRAIHRFFGDPESAWGPFKQPRRRVTGMGSR